MIFWVLMILAATITLFIYLKNKQADRERHRRERLQDKQEELMARLRAKKAKEVNTGE